MAQTPFSTVTTTYFGQWAAEVVDAATTYRRFWLGLPGAMIQLPPPGIGYTVDYASAETEHKLLSGGTAVTRRGDLKRRYSLNYVRIGGKDWQIIDGFYRRVFGLGPWCFKSPEDANVLTGAASMFTDLTRWNANVAPGTLATASVLPGVYPSSVMSWTGSTTASQVSLVCDIATATSVGTAIPYLPAEPLTFSFWARTATGTASVQPYLQTRDSTGVTSVSQVGGSAASLTTTWQRFSMSLAAGALSNTNSLYVVPIFVGLSATNPVIYLSAAQVEFESAATPFQMGEPVPRVVMPAGGTRTIDSRTFNQASVVLAEA